MAQTITAQFKTRRDVETAVERLVQKHGIAREAVRILPASQDNTAGTERAGADLEGGRPKTDTEGAPALEGLIRVSAEVPPDEADAVAEALTSCGGTDVAR